MILKTRKTMILDTWVTGSASLGEKFEGLGPRLEDLENMMEDLADDMGGLDSIEDLEEDIGTSETGSLGMGEIIEDLDKIGDSEVGTEELETMTEDLKIGIEDSRKLEDSVWVDWSLGDLTSGLSLVAALLGEWSVSLVSSMSPPSSLPSPPSRGIGLPEAAG